MFSIILNKYKNIIEKKGIINECFLIIQEEITRESEERLKEILRTIGLPASVIVKQKPKLKHRKIFNEIIKKQESYEKYKQEIEKINKIMKELNLKNKKEINANEEYFKKDKSYEKQFTIEERNKLKIYKLDNQSIMIASRWFESIDDFINLELGCSEFKMNMEKFH